MTDEKPSNNGEKTADGRFQPGNGGGPGRPAGSRNRATVLLDKLAEADAKAVLAKQIELAKDGDQRAADLILARVWPVRKGRPVSLDFPAISTTDDVVSAVGAVVDAVGSGDLTPDEGIAVASILEAKRKAIETSELEKRIKALEDKRK
ncbi:MAG: DUF5681 domain-containing protein [Reyranella sp.]|uniref:DUF5681 domain-containing protein n=1 Tax=Reyranella sp. TaxID=1929291 RepID=UPI003D121D29